MPADGLQTPPIAPELIYTPASFFERLNVGQMFMRNAPLEVELGSGDGSFLCHWAQLHPERNFLGVERLLGRLRKLDRKGRRAALSNLRLMRIEASYFMEYLLPCNTVAAVHVYFPDPWPKRKHRSHRLINSKFVELSFRVLQPVGEVFLRTDHSDYYQQMTECFGSDERFASIPTPPALKEVATDFERGFQARGVATLWAAYRKR